MSNRVEGERSYEVANSLYRPLLAAALFLGACQADSETEDEMAQHDEDEMAQHDVEISVAYQRADGCHRVEGYFTREFKELPEPEPGQPNVEFPFLYGESSLSPEGYDDIWIDEEEPDLLVHHEGNSDLDSTWQDKKLENIQIIYTIEVNQEDLEAAGCEVQLAILDEYVSEEDAFPLPEDAVFESGNSYTTDLVSQGVTFQIVPKD